MNKLVLIDDINDYNKVINERFTDLEKLIYSTNYYTKLMSQNVAYVTENISNTLAELEEKLSSRGI